MKITEVKVKLAPRSDDKLLAFATVILDNSFVIRDIKIIQGGRGLFVAMPSRKMTDRCPHCGTKNHLQASYCNHCGKKQAESRVRTDPRGRAKLHADIAHPINSRCRTELEQAIVQAYQDEAERSRQPGYVPAQIDDFDAGPEGLEEVLDGVAPATGAVEKPAEHKKTMAQGQSPAPKPTEKPEEKGPPPDKGGFGIFS